MEAITFSAFSERALNPMHEPRCYFTTRQRAYRSLRPLALKTHRRSRKNRCRNCPKPILNRRALPQSWHRASCRQRPQKRWPKFRTRPHGEKATCRNCPKRVPTHLLHRLRPFPWYCQRPLKQSPKRQVGVRLQAKALPSAIPAPGARKSQTRTARMNSMRKSLQEVKRGQSC